ncbi:hypothetical protein A6B39_05115 [Mannheimia granulomatis]|uniref:hypothetical protein n=1 Tax=Mannheimia granulomatis TaxID=85402 RepID=UPI00159DAE10|nr:hypothetical protein [Mannheimia granulomatis]QLB14876.1 hypothetical protein A6B39_05115 [Mannheimia granulomatis]
MQQEQVAQAVTNEQVFAKLCEVERLLKTKGVNEHSREVWGLEDVAAYFGYSKEHTSRSVVSSPHFPKPIALDGLRGKGRGAKKWVSGEVVKFCLMWKVK